MLGWGGYSCLFGLGCQIFVFFVQFIRYIGLSLLVSLFRYFYFEVFFYQLRGTFDKGFVFSGQVVGFIDDNTVFVWILGFGRLGLRQVIGIEGGCLGGGELE